MNKKEREERKKTIRSTVSGGSYVRCPNDHATVNLRAGRDGLGKYLDVWCTTPGCRAPQQRLRDEGRVV